MLLIPGRSTHARVEKDPESREVRATGLQGAMQAHPMFAGMLLMLVLFVVSPVQAVGDSRLVMADAWSIVHNGDLELGEFTGSEVGRAYSFQAEGSSHYDFFPWLAAVPAVPVILAIDMSHRLGWSQSSFELVRDDAAIVIGIERLLAAFLAAASAAILGTAALRLLRHRAMGLDRAPPGPWTHIGLILVVGMTTPLWSTTSRALGQHAAADVALGALVLAAVSAFSAPQQRRYAIAVGAAAAVVPWGRPGATGVAFVVAVAVAVRLRERRLVMSILGAGAVVGTMLAVANRVLAGVFVLRYVRAESEWQLHPRYVDVLVTNLVGPSRGAFIYCPATILGVVLALRRRGELRRWAIIGVIAFIAGWFVASGHVTSWTAGLSYGPRFMTEGILVLAPVAVAALADSWSGSSRFSRRLVAAAVLFSVGVHGLGAISNESWSWIGQSIPISVTPGHLWGWADLPVLRSL